MGEPTKLTIRERLRLRYRFWITGYTDVSEGELSIRFYRWRMQHWWPYRIRQLEIELGHYKRWLHECEEARSVARTTNE